LLNIPINRYGFIAVEGLALRTKLFAMKHIYKLFLALLVLSATISCSKDDDGTGTPSPIVGGEISAMKVITIPLPDANLTQTQYDGTLRGESVTLIKNGDHALTLAVSPIISDGPADLIIPALGKTIQYNITQPVLTGTPDSVMSDLFTSLESYTQAIGEPQIPELETSSKLVTAFETIYNDAGTEEKEAIAKFYQVNKSMIDQVMISAIAEESGRFEPTSSAEVAVGVFTAALQGLVIGTAIIVAADYVAVNPSVFAAVKIIGAIVSGVALGLVITKFIEFKESNSVADAISIGGISGINDRNTNDTALNLSHDNTVTTSISTYRRTVNMTDAASSNGLLQNFFSGYATYSSIISKVNSAITYVNTKVPFTIPHVTVRTVPAQTTAAAEVVNTEIFNQVALSVSHPNLQLVDAQLAGNGQLTLKVKIVGEPQSLSIESTLNYSYSDAFSNFSGTIPLKVDMEIDLSGTWSMAITLGAGVCDEILLLDEGGSSLTLNFNDNNTITFLSDPSGVGLNGAGFNQAYNLNDETLNISVTSEDGSFTAETTYNAVTNSFSGTYTDGWNGCSNTVTITKLD
jgi:hypothetical protein